jgi:hypothetical protein
MRMRSGGNCKAVKSSKRTKKTTGRIESVILSAYGFTGLWDSMQAWKLQSDPRCVQKMVPCLASAASRSRSKTRHLAVQQAESSRALEIRTTKLRLQQASHCDKTSCTGIGNENDQEYTFYRPVIHGN